MAEKMNVRVWFIDDQLSELQGRELLGLEASELTVSEPQGDAFEDALAEDWDLILVDEELWENQKPPHAVDGSSLVASLRAWARQQRRLLPTMVILTSNTSSFRDEIPGVGAWRPVAETFVQHEAYLGKTLDVEWLLSKADGDLAAKVSDLAQSYVSARDTFGDSGISLNELISFLKIPELGWKDHAINSLRETRPPITEGDGPDHPQRGPAVAMQWLLQRALAFPGLMLSDFHVAVSLNIKHDKLDDALNKNTAFANRLKECRYSGPLSTLFGRRWWGPGIDSLLSEMMDDAAPIYELLGLNIEDVIGSDDYVVVYDATLKEVGLEALDEAVRIIPRGWPAEAIQPWMRKVEAKGTDWLKAMVQPEDLERLS
ncbi:hypothetical protein ELH39_01045 [Rhizobium ruizarguesonis]|uniref:hypothetical protein n=1 Tax=Rhizobium ruizarguesonis TaxID=2081791 RepID=UPI00102F5F7E|nr:hypothetical protein [Rhizobium ruizarguesonis]TBB95936.1 hypothetical protein ELH39_01045 [Rhizobium ruizarguesonis]